ncbi:MAG: hypothetical protein ABL999_18165 [Pyrinomonadaceae bacterium]
MFTEVWRKKTPTGVRWFNANAVSLVGVIGQIDRREPRAFAAGVFAFMEW